MTYTYPPCQSIPGFPSNCDYPGIIPGCTHIHIPLPPCQSIPGFPSNSDYPGIILGCTHIHILPLPVRVSRDSLVTVTIQGSSWDAHVNILLPPFRDSLVTVTILGSSRDAHVHILLPPCQSIPGFPSNCDYPGIMPGCICTHTPNPPIRVSRDSLVTVTILGSSRDAHVHIILPPCQSIQGFPSNCDYPGIMPECTCTHTPTPCQSIPGFPSNCDYPGIIPGCTHIYIPLPPSLVPRL